MTKAELRKQMLIRRAALPPEEIAARSARITANVLSSEEWTQADILLAYYAVRGEADPEKLIRAAWEAGKKVYLPRTEGQEMIFLPYTVRTQLKKSRYGIPEPVISDVVCNDSGGSAGACRQGGDPARVPFEPAVPQRWSADISGNTLVIVPGAAFSPDGYRIGYGGGYYDRFFAARSEGVRLLGFAYDFQITQEIIPEPHDVRLDAVAAELQTMRF